MHSCTSYRKKSDSEIWGIKIAHLCNLIFVQELLLNNSTVKPRVMHWEPIPFLPKLWSRMVYLFHQLIQNCFIALFFWQFDQVKHTHSESGWVHQRKQLTFHVLKQNVCCLEESYEWHSWLCLFISSLYW